MSNSTLTLDFSESAPAPERMVLSYMSYCDGRQRYVPSRLMQLPEGTSVNIRFRMIDGDEVVKLPVPPERMTVYAGVVVQEFDRCVSVNFTTPYDGLVYRTIIHKSPNNIWAIHD